MSELELYAGCDALLSVDNKTKIGLIYHSIKINTIGINDWTRTWDNLIQSLHRKLSAEKR